VELDPDMWGMWSRSYIEFVRLAAGIWAG